MWKTERIIIKPKEKPRPKPVTDHDHDEISSAMGSTRPGKRIRKPNSKFFDSLA